MPFFVDIENFAIINTPKGQTFLAPADTAPYIVSAFDIFVMQIAPEFALFVIKSWLVKYFHVVVSVQKRSIQFKIGLELLLHDWQSTRSSFNIELENHCEKTESVRMERGVKVTQAF